MTEDISPRFKSHDGSTVTDELDKLFTKIEAYVKVKLANSSYLATAIMILEFAHSIIRAYVIKATS